VPFHNLCECKEIARLPPGAGADVGAVELDAAQVLRQRAVARVGVHRDGRLQLREVECLVVNELLVAVHFDGGVFGLRAVFLRAFVYIVKRRLVRREDAVLAARLDGHVCDRHPVVHVHRRGAGAFPLHRAVGRAVEADVADHVQDHVLGHHPARHFSLKIKAHRLGHLHEQFARAEDEPRVGVADAGGEFAERPRHAGVRIRAEKDFSWARVALPWERGVADAGEVRAILPLKLALGGVEFPVAVFVVNHVVKIGDALLIHEIAQDIDVAVGHAVRGENVMVGDDHHLLRVPDFRVFAELALEDADGPRPANIVGHQNIDVHPYVVAGLHLRLAAGAREDFFGQGHGD